MCWGLENTIRFKTQLMEIVDQCMQFGNPFYELQNKFQTLPQNVNNPWQNIPQDINNPFLQLGDKFQTLPQGIPKRILLKKLLSRHKRDHHLEDEGGLLGTDETDVEEFIEDFEDFKDSMGTKLSNLTCVLSKMGKLDSNFQINLDMFTSGMWEMMDLSKTLAGEDPVWRNSLINSFSNCYQIAENWPQESLDRNPLSKIFGRHMVFFKCAKKAQDKACAAAQTNAWMELAYGVDDGSIDWTQYGLPANKYERSALATLVMYDTASDEEKFIGDFFSSKGEH